MVQRRIGIWLLGAKGGVATTAILGLTALRKGLTGDTGLVSQLPRFADLDLAEWDAFVVGGHEIRDVSLADEAMNLAEISHAIDRRLVEQCRPELDEIDKSIRPGTLHNVGQTIASFAGKDCKDRQETPRAAILRMQADWKEFLAANDLERMIVVNVASTEPTVDESALPATWAEMEPLLDDAERCPLAASSLYAIAAFEMGMPYINFTPSLGSKPAALCELALANNTCHYGHDGKTGETLLKSALAPMFAQRNLDVMSWVGHNIFGNMDGKVLNDPLNKKTKVVSKDRLLGQILGYDPQTHISIEYIESLGDWKTAWDHIHFRGFLGTPMIMQFTWQGCDSLLAAPLVLDLIRFTELAVRRGETGLMTFLASFFKSPLGITENDFVRQFQMLEAWADEAAKP
ncbi:inositol-3-phosphate synthase [Lignipirellula cremea]|uniref:Inositol-3-phosphate synthase n=1 Tax=Lignipirellula cremea TaxID=2528010 RepID=A0A518DLZ5_9BACT|nr:inositol-3-phosphate synthase [Lignipirellula cremea]QDU92841.1 Inositol-3-phosphate synthase [Lignipirellula cremea]